MINLMVNKQSQACCWIVKTSLRHRFPNWNTVFSHLVWSFLGAETSSFTSFRCMREHVGVSSPQLQWEKILRSPEGNLVPRRSMTHNSATEFENVSDQFNIIPLCCFSFACLFVFEVSRVLMWRSSVLIWETEKNLYAIQSHQLAVLILAQITTLVACHRSKHWPICVLTVSGYEYNIYKTDEKEVGNFV